MTSISQPLFWCILVMIVVIILASLILTTVIFMFFWKVESPIVPPTAEPIRAGNWIRPTNPNVTTIMAVYDIPLA